MKDKKPDVSKMSIPKVPPYIIYNPHSEDLLVPSMMVEDGDDEWIRIASIDPGIINLGINIKTRYQRSKKVVNNLLARFDMVRNNSSSRVVQPQVYANIIQVLKQNQDLLTSSHYIVIESQPSLNYNLTRIGQHLIASIMMMTADQGNHPLIVELNSKIKRKYLGLNHGVEKKILKNQAILRAMELCHERDDPETIQILTKKGKKDDMSDAFCQEEAWYQILSQTEETT